MKSEIWNLKNFYRIDRIEINHEAHEGRQEGKPQMTQISQIFIFFSH